MSGTMDMTETDRRAVKTGEDLEMATAMLIFALKKNIGGFRFCGLRIPRIIQIWDHDTDLSDMGDVATELSIFQEHLADRIVSLSGNTRMTRRTWRLNEKTRPFRENELRDPRTAREIVDQMVALVNALFDRNESAAIDALWRAHETRMQQVKNVSAVAQAPTHLRLVV